MSFNYSIQNSRCCAFSIKFILTFSKEQFLKKIMLQSVNEPQESEFVIIDCSDIKEIELDSEKIHMEEK